MGHIFILSLSEIIYGITDGASSAGASRGHTDSREHYRLMSLSKYASRIFSLFRAFGSSSGVAAYS